jgi:hypothetical protein
MKKNLGRWDKNIRLILGASIIILGASLNSIWGVLGMILLYQHRLVFVLLI